MISPIYIQISWTPTLQGIFKMGDHSIRLTCDSILKNQSIYHMVFYSFEKWHWMPRDNNIFRSLSMSTLARYFIHESREVNIFWTVLTNDSLLMIAGRIRISSSWHLHGWRPILYLSLRVSEHWTHTLLVLWKHSFPWQGYLPWQGTLWCNKTCHHFSFDWYNKDKTNTPAW